MLRTRISSCILPGIIFFAAAAAAFGQQGQQGSILTFTQKVNGSAGTVYTPGQTIEGDVTAGVSVDATGEVTYFRVHMKMLDAGMALVDESYANSLGIQPGASTIFGGSDPFTVPGVLPSASYTCRMILQYQDNDTLNWVTIETKDKVFTLDD